MPHQIQLIKHLQRHPVYLITLKYKFRLKLISAYVIL